MKKWLSIVEYARKHSISKQLVEYRIKNGTLIHRKSKVIKYRYEIFDKE